MKKRLLGIVVMICMMIGTLPMNVLAAETGEETAEPVVTTEAEPVAQVLEEPVLTAVTEPVVEPEAEVVTKTLIVYYNNAPLAGTKITAWVDDGEKVTSDTGMLDVECDTMAETVNVQIVFPEGYCLEGTDLTELDNQYTVADFLEGEAEISWNAEKISGEEPETGIKTVTLRVLYENAPLAGTQMSFQIGKDGEKVTSETGELEVSCDVQANAGKEIFVDVIFPEGYCLDDKESSKKYYELHNVYPYIEEFFYGDIEWDVIKDSEEKPAESNPNEKVYEDENGNVFREITAEGNSNAKISGKEEVLPSGTTLVVQNVTSGETYDKAVETAKKKIDNLNKCAVVDISLLDASGVEIHQMGDYVSVTLPIPEGISLDKGKTLAVYRLEADGTLTKCKSTVKDGKVTLRTNHFSTYVFAEKEAQKAEEKENKQEAPKTGDATNAVMFAIMMFAAAGCMALTGNKKSKIK